MRPLLPLVE